MNLFKDLQRELLNTSNTLHKKYNKAIEEAIEIGDIEMFMRLTEELHLTGFAHRESGRLNHAMLRSTIDSFQ